MRFEVVSSGFPRAPKPYVVLRRDNWDDYGFKTMFDAVLILSDNGTEYSLGNVKILRRGQTEGRTEVPSKFRSLDAEFCSLGQSAEYYRTLNSMPPDLAAEYLGAMRDAAFDTRIRDEFANEPGWQTSLLRFGEAENALAVGIDLASGSARRPGVASFVFNWVHHGSQTPIEFEFDDTSSLPGRCNVLVGYNGVGKTTLLADLAMTVSRAGVDPRDTVQSRISGDDTTFGSVIAVTYSAFDTFKTPDSIVKPRAGETTAFGYTYCGLRQLTADRNKHSASKGDTFLLKSIHEIELEFEAALTTAGRRENRGHLVEVFEILSAEPSFGRIGVDLNRIAQNPGKDVVIDDFKRLSTGHKIVLNIATQLAAHLRPRSLVLIDEPETHLHPPLTAALLRAVQHLLDKYDSFAVVATHSPVVVQEIPAKFVKILERAGNIASTETAEIETFGESIGTITRFVFSLDSSATDYQGVLADLADHYSLEEIEDMFQPRLSTQARALVLNYMRRA
ncbi:UNVERIFIED_ORG: energy-coupling factor transporter ATP-binding protein EcfA2 [Gordonia westfalica J30]